MCKLIFGQFASCSMVMLDIITATNIKSLMPNLRNFVLYVYDITVASLWLEVKKPLKYTHFALGMYE